MSDIANAKRKLPLPALMDQLGLGAHAKKSGLLRPNRKLRHLLFPIAELDRFLRE
jgi:hypothetical protein